MNKRIPFIIFLIIAASLLLTACVPVEKVENSKPSSMFIYIEATSNWTIVYHRDTKVMYAVSNGSYNVGTFTLLVNPDGTPMTYD